MSQSDINKIENVNVAILRKRENLIQNTIKKTEIIIFFARNKDN
jgi:hypothetical protein